MNNGDIFNEFNNENIINKNDIINIKCEYDNIIYEYIFKNDKLHNLYGYAIKETLKTIGNTHFIKYFINHNFLPYDEWLVKSKILRRKEKLYGIF